MILFFLESLKEVVFLVTTALGFLRFLAINNRNKGLIYKFTAPTKEITVGLKNFWNIYQ